MIQYQIRFLSTGEKAKYNLVFQEQTVKSQEVLGVCSSAATEKIKIEDTDSLLGAGINRKLVGSLLSRGALTVMRNELVGKSCSPKRQM